MIMLFTYQRYSRLILFPQRHIIHNGLELGAVLLDNFNFSLAHCAKLMMCEVREAASTS
jgi:hypothetical protein